MKEQEGSGGSRYYRESVVQPKNEEFLKLGNSKQLQQQPVAEGRGKMILRNKRGLCRGRQKLVSVRVTFPHRC